MKDYLSRETIPRAPTVGVGGTPGAEDKSISFQAFVRPVLLCLKHENVN